MRGGSVRLACLGALLTVMLCAAPAQAIKRPRIINGQAASQGEYPAQGVLKRFGTFICGGTLVSNRHFLTAAHCVTNEMTGVVFPASQFSVELGNVNPRIRHDDRVLGARPQRGLQLPDARQRHGAVHAGHARAGRTRSDAA